MNNLTGFYKKKNFRSNPTASLMKLVNLLTKKGLKMKSNKILIKALANLKQTKNNEFNFNNLLKILNINSPIAELKSIKLGSSKYLVPTPLNSSRKLLITIIC